MLKSETCGSFPVAPIRNYFIITTKGKKYQYPTHFYVGFNYKKGKEIYEKIIRLYKEWEKR